MFRILALANFLLLLTVPVRADMAAGLSAYDGGEYGAARRAWLICAEAGNPDAQIALAGLYAGGAGVTRNYSIAAAWFRRAARQGDAIAQLNLGDMYSRGQGVRRDLVAAWVWLGLAARQGNDWARDRRGTIARDMNPAMRRDAARRLEAWRPAER